MQVNKENLSAVLAGLAKYKSQQNENDGATAGLDKPLDTDFSEAAASASQHAKENKDIHDCALDFLSRREHSEFELKNKLLKKAFDVAKIATVLKYLIAENLLSDERFCEVYVRSCINKGKGRLYIQEALRKRGIDEVLIKQHLDQHAAIWLVQIEKVRYKRFGETLPKDYKARAKQMRFLQSRGFTIEQINKIFKN